MKALNRGVKEKMNIFIIYIFFNILFFLYYRKIRAISFKVELQYIAVVIMMFICYCLNVFSLNTLYILIMNAVSLLYLNEYMMNRRGFVGLLSRRQMATSLYLLLISGLINVLFPNCLSIILFDIVYVLGCFINYEVKYYRGTDIELADLAAVKTFSTVIKRYRIHVGIDLILAMILDVMWLMVIAYTYETISGGSLYLRIVCLIIIIAMMVTMLNTRLLSSLGIQFDSYKNTVGWLFNLVLQYRYKKEFVEQIEEVNFDDLQKEYGSENTGFEMKPNVIVIMNEAFSDLRVYGDLKTNIPVLPNIDAMKEQMEYGYIYTSVLGGNTAYSEFEFLTGDSSRFFFDCPYAASNISGDAKISNFASYLKKYGNYRTVAMHSYEKANWRRPVVYNAFGFDEQYYMDDFTHEETIRGFISDKSHYKEIIKLFEEKESGKPLFSFNVTMQNHGGYNGYVNLEEQVAETNINSDVINHYLTLMHESDKAWKFLTDYFQLYHEPIVIVMFGDHQPKLDDDLLKKKCTDKVADIPDELLKYKVPVYVWKNYEKKSEIIPDMSLNFLSVFLKKDLKMPMTGYDQYLLNLQKHFPIVTAKTVVGKSRQEDSGLDMIGEYRRIARRHILRAEKHEFFEKV